MWPFKKNKNKPFKYELQHKKWKKLNKRVWLSKCLCVIGGVLICGGVVVPTMIYCKSSVKTGLKITNTNVDKYLIPKGTQIAIAGSSSANRFIKNENVLLNVKMLSDDNKGQTFFTIVGIVNYGFLIDPDMSDFHLNGINGATSICLGDFTNQVPTNSECYGVLIGRIISQSDTYPNWSCGNIQIDKNVNFYIDTLWNASAFYDGKGLRNNCCVTLNCAWNIVVGLGTIIGGSSDVGFLITIFMEESYGNVTININGIWNVKQNISSSFHKLTFCNCLGSYNTYFNINPVCNWYSDIQTNLIIFESGKTKDQNLFCNLSLGGIWNINIDNFFNAAGRSFSFILVRFVSSSTTNCFGAANVILNGLYNVNILENGSKINNYCAIWTVLAPIGSANSLSPNAPIHKMILDGKFIISSKYEPFSLFRFMVANTDKPSNNIQISCGGDWILDSPITNLYKIDADNPFGFLRDDTCSINFDDPRIFSNNQNNANPFEDEEAMYLFDKINYIWNNKQINESDQTTFGDNALELKQIYDNLDPSFYISVINQDGQDSKSKKTFNKGCKKNIQKYIKSKYCSNSIKPLLKNIVKQIPI